jgi:hypothetical protein
LSSHSNATWIDAVKGRKRPARRLVLTEGDVGAQRTTKIGGWTAWDQSSQRPTCDHHGRRMELVAQIDQEVGADTYWGGGGHAFLFAYPPGCGHRRAELVIQTT